MSPSGLHAAIIDQLIQPRIHIKLPAITTPFKQFVSAQASAYAREAVADARKDAFDQLPVVDDEGHVTGLVYVAQLRKLPDDALVSNCMIPLEESGQLRIEDGISKAVQILHTKPASLVTDGVKVVGLVHRSDLNKHPARTYFYLWLSSLEMMLARLVSLRLPSNAWIEHLGEQAQIRVLDKMKFESRRNNSIDPIEYLDLSNLVRIIAKNQIIYTELGFDSRNRLEDEIGGLVDLRHDIMHPVRTLVSDAESMGVLANREKTLRAVNLTVQRILKRA